MTREEIVVGLDIGTTKVGTVIAAGDAGGRLRVIGVGSTPSRGIKRGVVVDVEETVAAIGQSVERAAHMAGVKVENVIVGVTGDHIESSNCHAAVTVAGAQGVISRDDVWRVLQAAALEVPRDREIIHSLPRTFAVDGHSGVLRPVGMNGQKLEVETHIVTGKAPFLQNAVQCVERAGFKVEALVLEPIATAEAVTTPDEREMGVILIDIGGGTSDIAVFHDGSIVYSGVLPVGGNHVTRDIAIGLRTPFEIAENLKIDSGAAMREMIPHGEALEIIMAGSGEQLRIPRAILGEIIEARMSELFELARDMMHQSGARKRLPGGVILSGGGALLPGAIELANSVFAMPVRLGTPQNVTGWSEQVSIPQLATVVGLCRFAFTQRQLPGNQVAIPPMAALAGRRIWGAIASADENRASAPKVSAPNVSAEPKKPKPGNNATLLDVVPNIMDAPPRIVAPRPIAPASNAPASATTPTNNSSTVFKVDSMGAVAPSQPPTQALSNEVSPAPTRAESATKLAFEARSATSSPQPARTENSSGDIVGAPAPRPSNRTDEVFASVTPEPKIRRSPAIAPEIERPTEISDAGFRDAGESSNSKSWWDKLKHFLGFDKNED